jgi:hypothetical protein
MWPLNLLSSQARASLPLSLEQGQLIHDHQQGVRPTVAMYGQCGTSAAASGNALTLDIVITFNKLVS